MARRLRSALDELHAAPEFDYVVVNDDLERCLDEIRGIVHAEALRTSRIGLRLESRVKLFRERDRPDSRRRVRQHPWIGALHACIHPREVAKGTESKYLGVLVAAKYARELNSLAP